MSTIQPVQCEYTICKEAEQLGFPFDVPYNLNALLGTEIERSL